MLNDLNLKGNELLIYALVYGFSQDGETKFRGSISYIMDFTGSSRGTVINSLNSLVDKGLILKFSDQRNGVTFNEYSTIPPVQKLDAPQLNFAPSPGTKIEPYNNTLDKNRDKKGGKRQFIPPNETEVQDYFHTNGYTKEAASRAFKYYAEADWVDARGNKVLNWKQKMQIVWFKEEHKITEAAGIFESSFSGLRKASEVDLSKYDK